MFIHKSELSEGLGVEGKTTSVSREGGTGVCGKFSGVGVQTCALPIYFDLEGRREVFAEFFGFLFDNTSQCYLLFASLFPTL